jgi:nicotinamide mononucleotide adenylyltransferase
MFEMAADFAKFNTEFEIMGGYLSPVSDAYKKAGLASSQHRYDKHSLMCIEQNR